MKEKPKVPMPGSRLNDPTPGELRGDPGGGDSERKAEPSPPNFTPTVLDTVGRVVKKILQVNAHLTGELWASFSGSPEITRIST